jgi:ATP-dependent DNA ligase
MVKARRLSADRAPRGRHGLFTRRGHDWTDRYPASAAAAAKLRAKDGEAVVTGADGVAVFDAQAKATDAMLYAFDVTAEMFTLVECRR